MVDRKTKSGTASNNFMYIGIFKCLCDTLGPSNNDVIFLQLVTQHCCFEKLKSFCLHFSALTHKSPWQWYDREEELLFAKIWVTRKAEEVLFEVKYEQSFIALSPARVKNLESLCQSWGPENPFASGLQFCTFEYSQEGRVSPYTCTPVRRKYSCVCSMCTFCVAISLNAGRVGRFFRSRALFVQNLKRHIG